MATVTGPKEAMENCYKEREQLRRVFKKNCSQLELALTAKMVDKEQVLASLRQLEDKSDRLFLLDEQIRENLFSSKHTEEELANEFDEMEFYREEVINYKSRCEVMMNSQDEQTVSSRRASNDPRRKFKLPQLELKRFDGNVRNWIGFWGQFKKIHEDDDIDPEDKFQYLFQATVPGTAARELIESFPPSGSNYNKAIDQMKARFARDEFLIEVYVRELLDLVLKQASNAKPSMSLASLYDKLETQLRALESLGVTSDKYEAMLFPLVESALPEEILKSWERYRTSNTVNKDSKVNRGEENVGNFYKTNLLSMLLDFLRREVESEERINLAQTSFGVGKESGRNQKVGEKSKLQKQGEMIYTASALYSSNSRSQSDRGKNVPLCIFCDKSHPSQECFKAQNLTLDERRAKVMNKRGCFSCLKINHTSRNCKAFIKCLICTKKHYPIMCSDLPVKTNSVKTGDRVENVLTNNIHSDTLLQTILVRLVNNNSESIVRALLDSASQRSYIMSKCVTDLGYVRSSVENIIQVVFGGVQLPLKQHSVFDVEVENLDRSFKIKLSVLEQDRICSFIPKLENTIYLNQLKERNIILNEVNVPNAPRDIGLLLGADVFGKLLTGCFENLNDTLFAIQTHFGWTLMGQLLNTTSTNMTTFSGVTNISLTDLWSLDILGIKDPAEMKTKEIQEIETMRNFKDTITVNENQRYEVVLPWSPDHTKLLNNKKQAETRLLSTTRKLKNLNKFEDYDKILREWENLGIIEEIDEQGDGENNFHYLPHHAVIKESSRFTKIRPVFDASAKDEGGNSLNDCLKTGPNLIEVIPSLILKFRIRSIGVTADIEKAFLQISISSRDRDFLRFLWWHDFEENRKKIYRHCRVVFGLRSSPFLLAATINYHLSEAPDHFKETAERLNESFYVDNCIASFNDIRELEKFIIESKELMALGQFNLRDWMSNVDTKFTNSIESCETSVLGLLWNTRKDVIYCDLSSFTKVQNTAKTRRGLLSAAQRIFDPIGFTCPFTLIPKILLQETWQIKTGWDDELPYEITKNFENWLKQVHFLNFCNIPRSLNFGNNFDLERTTVHIFCDSSKIAYASCVFLRIDMNEECYIQLLQAKSRIAPKKITIPRLELLACMIGVRLGQTIKRVREFENLNFFYWTDSMVALTWIQSTGPWKSFVENRVKEIRSFTTVKQWNHVPGNQNPADVASRGCSGKVLMENKWWEGPSWLRDNRECWPHSVPESADIEIEAERRKICSTNVVSNNQDFTNRLSHFSKFSQILRMVSWILRFCYNCSFSNCKKTKRGQLTCDEIKYAEICIMKLIQQDSFKDKTNLKNLQFFKDKEGLLRIKTKLLLGNDSDCFKFPILLPFNHPLIHKLIFEQHRLNGHVGVQTLLCIMREKFWILRGRRTIKKVISKCSKCKRFSGKFVDTPFAPLPKTRINQAAAFEITGIDLAGPLYLKGGHKVWIVLFTCALYRALHLELVQALSTDSFLMALRRFLARRGRVTTIYSDNGSNFVGANNLLKTVDWDQILEYSSVKQIKWIFNPPTAAWWGGWWERLVRIVKELLRRNLGRAVVNFEELMTILCDCESIINKRPLTYISEDNEDLIPLSPSMFIQDLPTNETPDLDTIDRSHLLSRHRYLQKIRDGIRTRFRKEYLAELVHSGQRKIGTLKEGDIVYVASDNVKRLNWPLGKILEVIPGRDGIARIARVKTQNGEILRPFQRLYPLEVSNREVSNREYEDELKMSTVEDRTEDRCQNEDSYEDRKITEEEAVSSKKQTIENTKGKSVVTRRGRVVKAPDRFEFD